MGNDENSEIEMLIKGQQKKKEVEIVIPERVKITKNAFEKAKTIAKIIDTKSKTGSYEWYSYPLARKNNESVLLGERNGDDYIVRDIILPRKQEISSAHVAVSGEDVALAAGEVRELNETKKLNHYIIGWLHSHASFSAFHSGTDDNNIMTVLNSVSLNTEKPFYKTFDLIESVPEIKSVDGKIMMVGKNDEDGLVELHIDSASIEALLKKYSLGETDQNRLMVREILEESLRGNKIKLKEPVLAGFCYSIVINNKGISEKDVHAEIAVFEEEAISKKKKQYKRKTTLEVVEVSDDIEVKESDLEQLVDERIEIPKPVVVTVVGTVKDWWKKGKGYAGYNYAGYDEADFYNPRTRTRGTHGGKKAEKDYSKSCKKEGKEKKEKKDLSTPEQTVETFVEQLFDYCYSSEAMYAGFEEYLDELVTTTILYEDFSRALDQVGEAVANSAYHRYTPQILDLNKKQLTDILLKYVTDGNDRMLKIMSEFNSGLGYDQHKAIKRMYSALAEDKQVGDLLHEKKEDG